MSLITYTYYGVATQTAICRSTTKHNKAFKSDSQRLAVSLRSSIAKRRSHLNAALAYSQAVIL
ncbi:hypothetical protein CRN22_12790 [Vibrio vulnificus]|nr:hypothetical protein CRN22_12790 [Vibrio vulnificus]HAS8133648.1 hypothetical protein [Vibrio vulnificus]